jgi:hypothetical protein
MTFESVERRELLAADLRLAAAVSHHTAGTAEIHFVEVGGGDGAATNDSKWFVADSFSFGVEREMKESGEKGGTEDINIGVGELQEAGSKIFVADSYSFGVEREMKESGEKGGT